MSEENAGEDQLQPAKKLYKAGKYLEAATAYQGLVASGHKTAPVYRGLGEVLYKLRRYDEAVSAYTSSIKGEPNSEVYGDLGEALFMLRRFEEAIVNYQTAADACLKRADDARAASLEAQKDSSLEKQTEAVNKRKEAEAADEEYSDRNNDLGYAYLCINKYDEAIEKLRVAKVKGPQYPYAYHTLGSVLWTQGNYKDAMVEVKKARERYVACEDLARENGWKGHFAHFGGLLHETFGELNEAERVYQEGLKLDESELRSWIGLVALYLERIENYPKHRNKAYQDAERAYKKAKELITLRNAYDVESLIMAGELHLTMKDYDQAETCLKMALSKDEAANGDKRYKKSAKPNTDLGILCMRTDQFKPAIRYFEAASKIDADDLSLRSNLAEAYLRDDQLEEAEREFQKVLRCAPDHVESRIGLGGVYTALADTGDPDMYAAAIVQYSEAIRLVEQKCGSKRLKNKELALVHYSLGYARVKSYEVSRTLKDRNRLHDARVNFRACFKNDADHHRAKRAIEKIDKVLPPRSPQRFIEEWGPLVILLSSLAVFLWSQIIFIWSFLDKTKLPSWLAFLDQAQHLAASAYVPLTFGSLILMVASCYLPQLLKLKVAGIELEKSPVDQITFVGTVGISKQ